MKKRLIIFVLLLAVSNLYSQSINADKELKEYENRYQQGERGIDFFKKYLKHLVGNYKNESLDSLVDSYLKEIPRAERYSGEYLTVFLTGIHSIKAFSFKELMANPNHVFNETNQLKLEKKIRDVYLAHIYHFFSKYNSEGIVDKTYSFKNMEKNLSKIDDTEDLVSFVNMAVAIQLGDIQKTMAIFNRQIIEKKYQPSAFAFRKRIILNSCLSVILENCNKEQCKTMIQMLLEASEKGNRIFLKRIEEFEGKMMYFEAEETERIKP